jgi:tetratricopeptide (TPR) repeat protein
MPTRVLPEPTIAPQTPWRAKRSASCSRAWARTLPHMRQLITTLLLFLSLPVHAQVDSKVLGYFVSVHRLYEALEYEQALEQITQARRLPLTVADKVDLSLYEGLILADMSRWEESAAAFKAALSLDPVAKLPVKVSPKVTQHLEAVRQQVQRGLALAKAPLPEAERPLVEQKTLKTPHARMLPDSHALPATATEVLQRDPLPSQVLIPTVGGGVLTVAGGTFWALSRRELSRLRNNAREIATREDVRSSASRGRTYQTVGVGLLGVGLVSLGTAAGLYALGKPPDEVALGVSTDGTSAFVYGVWP